MMRAANEQHDNEVIRDEAKVHLSIQCGEFSSQKMGCIVGL